MGIEKKQELKMLKAAEKEKENAAAAAAVAAAASAAIAAATATADQAATTTKTATATDSVTLENRKRSHDATASSQEEEQRAAKRVKDEVIQGSTLTSTATSATTTTTVTQTTATTTTTTTSSTEKKSDDEDVMIIESEDTAKIWRDLEIRRHRLIEKCRMAMHLCLSRYSTHYKALYRLAHLYYTYRPMRDYGKCRDLLLGLPGMAHWAHKPHMPALGLFQERSKTNFFNGIWKTSTKWNDQEAFKTTRKGLETF